MDSERQSEKNEPRGSRIFFYSPNIFFLKFLCWNLSDHDPKKGSLLDLDNLIFYIKKSKAPNSFWKLELKALEILYFLFKF